MGIKLFDLIYNKMLCRRKKVNCKTFPVISGRIIINNKGTLNIGSSVYFNCSIKSNYVGMYKPCTLAVSAGAKLEIGDHSGFSGVSIYCAESITIGNYVNCGGNVSIWDTDFHPLEKEARRHHELNSIKKAPIVIEDDVFIGANSIILKGVHIGAAAIIGAGSVVTKNIPAGETWAGNPAKFIRRNN